ncbi:hypothetical protein ES703_124988 [subsurface metagenome]
MAPQPEVAEKGHQIPSLELLVAGVAVGGQSNYGLADRQTVDAHIQEAAYSEAEKGENSDC